MNLPISLACGIYDRTFPLIDGSVRVEGIDLNFVPMTTREIHRRQARHAEFDASEFSLSTLMMLHARGDRRFVAIPVYPSRRFRHEHIWINRNSGIRTPADLKGKRIGIYEFTQTAAVWVRGFLQDDYGVRTSDMEWYFGGYNEPEPHFKPRIAYDLEGIRTKVIAPTESIDSLLDKGEIDAVFPNMPASFERGSPNVVRLFSNFREIEEDYFRRTRIFPIMHVLVVKREIYEKNPWVAVALYKAFAGAKKLALRRLAHPPANHTTLPWVTEQVEAAQRLMGRDYWSYGLEENRHVLETAARYAHEQGLVTEPIARVDELFAPETHAGVFDLPA